MACLLPHFISSSWVPYPLFPPPPAPAATTAAGAAAAAASGTAVIVHPRRLILLRTNAAVASSSSASSVVHVDDFEHQHHKYPPACHHPQSALAASDALLSANDALISAAAAETIALARAAADFARTAALSILASPDAPRWSPPVCTNSSSRSFPLNLMSTEASSSESEAAAVAVNPNMPPPSFTISPPPLFYEVEERVVVAVESQRKAIRASTVRKTSTADGFPDARASSSSSSSSRSSSSRRKKAKSNASLQEAIDYPDSLRSIFAAATKNKLLSAKEEFELSQGIQDLLSLDALQKELKERNSGLPTFAQWAEAAGVDQITLRKRLNHGWFCKEKMIKSNLRLVISIAKKYQGAGLNLPDLILEGCKGLVVGTEKFDASKGYKFSTYAHWWIKQAVRRSLSEQSRTIRLPVHIIDATYRVREAKKQLYSENGRDPNYKEVAEAAGLSMKRLASVMLSSKVTKSLDQCIWDNPSLKLSDVTADPDAETVESFIVTELMKQDLNKVLDTLSPKEKQVVQWRFGLEDGRIKSLEEVGDIMEVSRERIRQIESCAFRKLRSRKRVRRLQQYMNM